MSTADALMTQRQAQAQRACQDSILPLDHLGEAEGVLSGYCSSAQSVQWNTTGGSELPECLQQSLFPSCCTLLDSLGSLSLSRLQIEAAIVLYAHAKAASESFLQGPAQAQCPLDAGAAFQ